MCVIFFYNTVFLLEKKKNEKPNIKKTHNHNIENIHFSNPMERKKKNISISRSFMYK